MISLKYSANVTGKNNDNYKPAPFTNSFSKKTIVGLAHFTNWLVNTKH